MNSIFQRTWAVAGLYGALALLMTWPVARDLGTRLASDLYDPAFNCWVLAWTTGQIALVLRGDLTGITHFWNGNIFHPEPMTLAYSEHLFGQALQVLPIQMVTGNILISYNLLFISTFALSGLAMYLLVRDLTGRPEAAFAAGVAFAFVPYRLSQISHLQVLSGYWMAFALVGFHRYFVRVSEGAAQPARRRALAGGAAAFVMQNWSCGYYMLFFAPFVPIYCLYEMAQRRLLANRRVWTQLAVAAASVALATWPFASGYVQLRDVADLGVRSLRDLAQFSADTYSFVTPPRRARVLSSWLSGYPKPEASGFPGVTILVLAAAGLASSAWQFGRELRWKSLSDGFSVGFALSVMLATGSAIVSGWFFVNGSLTLALSSRTIRYADAAPALTVFGISTISAWIMAISLRRGRGTLSPSAVGFFAVSALAAALLALGPEIEVRGRGIGTGPYLWFFENMPGFDGLRVPARYLMLVMMFLSVLAGVGAAAALALRRPLGAIVIAAAIVSAVAEGWAVPMSMNAGGRADESLVAPPPPSGAQPPPIYEFIRNLPGRVALVELPFGDSAYELQAVFYAGYHRRPIANGYSGWFPRSYRRNVGPLREVLEDPDRALRALGRLQASHVLVHEAAWPAGQGQQVSSWLTTIGATSVATSGSDRLFELPAIPVPPE
jgi:hypothetical protein